MDKEGRPVDPFLRRWSRRENGKVGDTSVFYQFPSQTPGVSQLDLCSVDLRDLEIESHCIGSVQCGTESVNTLSRELQGT